MPQYLSTDPNAGQGPKYLSTDPNAGQQAQQKSKEPSGAAYLKGLFDTSIGGLFSTLQRANPLVHGSAGVANVLGDMAKSQWDEGVKTVDLVKKFLSDRDPLTGLEATGHGIATALPVFGPAAAHAGERISQGEIAGGLGEATGLLLPGAVSHAGPAMSKVGRGVSRVAEGFKKPLLSLGALDAVMQSPTAGVGIMAAPYAADFAGKGLQRAGSAMEGFRNATTKALSPEPIRASGGEPIQASGASMPKEYAGGKIRLVKKGPPLEESLNQVVLETLRESPSASPVSKGGSPTPRYTDPRSGGYDVPAGESTPAPITTPAQSTRLSGVSSASADNILRNAPYGEGGIMPSNMLPTELRDAAMEGLNHRTIGGGYDQTYRGVVPDFSFEAGQEGIPGLTVGEIPADNPAAKLAALLKTPSEAQIARAIGSRNTTGHWGALTGALAGMK